MNKTQTKTANDEISQSSQQQLDNKKFRNTLSKNTVITIVISAVAIILIGITAFAVFFGVPYLKYQDAVSMMEAGLNEDAMIAFYELGDFMYSKRFHTECRYRHAIELYKSEKFTDAMVIFTDLGDYADSKNMSIKCKYHIADSFLEAKNYDEAIVKFEELGDFEDCKEKIKECQYLKACALLKKDNYEDALPVFESIKNYKDSKEKIKNCKYMAAIELIDNGDIVSAYKKLTALKDYKKAKSKAKSIKPTYDRIMAKDNIFRNGYWGSTYTERCHLTTQVISDNKVRIQYAGSNSAFHQVQYTLDCEWNPSTGTLDYTNGTRYDTIYGVNTYISGDGHGYFYYENGYLTWVNTKENYTEYYYYQKSR